MVSPCDRLSPEQIAAIKIENARQRDENSAGPHGGMHYYDNVDVVAKLVATVERQQEELPKCATCGTPASCFGAYEHIGEPVQFACDSCCGHGNEDGWCKPVVELLTDYNRLVNELDDANAQSETIQTLQARLERRQLRVDAECLRADDAEGIIQSLRAHSETVRAAARLADDAKCDKLMGQLLELEAALAASAPQPAMCEQPCEQHEDCDRLCILAVEHDGRHECKNHTDSAAPVPATKQGHSDYETRCTLCGAKHIHLSASLPATVKEK